MFKVLDINEYRHLFCDDKAFETLVEALRSSFETDFRPIAVGQQIIGSSLSAAYTKKLLAEKFAQRVLERPDLLDELAERLDSDEVE